MKVIVHDVSGKDVWFGPYKEIEIHELSVWAVDESGRKVTLAYRDATGFWIVTDGDRKARGKTIKVSRNAVIKAMGKCNLPNYHRPGCLCGEAAGALEGAAEAEAGGRTDETHGQTDDLDEPKGQSPKDRAEDDAVVEKGRGNRWPDAPKGQSGLPPELHEERATPQELRAAKCDEAFAHPPHDNCPGSSLDRT